MLTFRDHAFTDLSGYVHKICGQISPLNYFSGFAEIRKGLYSEKAAETAVFPDTEKTI